MHATKIEYNQKEIKIENQAEIWFRREAGKTRPVDTAHRC